MDSRASGAEGAEMSPSQVPIVCTVLFSGVSILCYPIARLQTRLVIVLVTTTYVWLESMKSFQIQLARIQITTVINQCC